MNNPINLTKLEADLINNLPSDSKYLNFISALNNLENVNIKEGSDLVKYQNSLSNAKTEEEVLELLQVYFAKPYDVMRILRVFDKSAEEFQTSHKDFYLLEISRRQYVLEKVFTSSLESNNKARITGECEDERNSGKQTCKEAAYLAAAGCGLLSPTLIGALACGAFVIGGDALCHGAVDRDYKICKKYE